mmetsp:Transcript_10322/g.22940  ORF Transcript_10322/g.22940 Transcript_10322/m.22940 type:complete len:103 (-) Transcript_10322:292-600(-)
MKKTEKKLQKKTVVMTALAHLLQSDVDEIKCEISECEESHCYELGSKEFIELCSQKRNCSYQIVMNLSSDPSSLDYILKHEELMSCFFDDLSVACIESDNEK